MAFVRTTPPRPVDVVDVFPELAPLARAAIRLHPRAGAPSVRESSVGGPLLWLAEEPWPHCEAVHPGTGRSKSPADIRLERRELPASRVADAAGVRVVRRELTAPCTGPYCSAPVG